MSEPTRERVEVWWHDAATENGWTSERELLADSNRTIQMRSLGYLLSETEKHVVIAMTRYTDEAVTGPPEIIRKVAEVLSVPRGWMERIDYLDRPREDTTPGGA